jgi:hypothetical protein
MERHVTEEHRLQILMNDMSPFISSSIFSFLILPNCKYHTHTHLSLVVVKTQRPPNPNLDQIKPAISQKKKQNFALPDLTGDSTLLILCFWFFQIKIK